MSTKSQIGVIGLAVMGSNLARNFASRGLQVSIFNRTYAKTEDLLKNHGQNMVGFEKIEEFLASLEKPRRILLMVKSGQPVDDFIGEIMLLLEADDIVIDGGNSNWHDTMRRQEYLDFMGSKAKIVGSGISGGEEGALHGPSIMPGGDPKAVEHILPVLQMIAAKDFAGQPCVTNIGTGASGHFVKMVHNGIEYALMQGIAEIYGILRSQGHSPDQMLPIFKRLNSGDTKSFLLDITEIVLQSKDETGFLIDKLDRSAGSKGTGKWTVEAAMDLGIATPSIAAALFARVLSSKTQNFDFKLQTQTIEPARDWGEDDFQALKSGLEGVYLAAYLQGLDLIVAANEEYKWGINLQEVIRIWQGGCIIRSQLLQNLWQNWQVPFELSTYIAGLQEVNSQTNQPLPVWHATFDYLQGLVSQDFPQNLTQAQRDYFGAHTYKRVDKEGVFTGGWVSTVQKTS